MELTIAKRLWVLMLVAVLSLLLVGASGIYVSRSLSDVLKETHENILPSEVTLLQAAGGLQRLRGQESCSTTCSRTRREKPRWRSG